MAQRFVPSYLHSSSPSTSGWYVPQFNGGNSNFGCKFLDPVQLPAIHLPATTQLQPATTQLLQATNQLLEAANQQSIQQQAVAKLAFEPVDAGIVCQAQVPKVGSGESVANVASTHVDKVAAQKAQPIKKYKYSGMVLATLASATISLGVSNTVVTALTVMTSTGSTGCFGTGNSKYNSLGPSNDVMKALDWSWVTVGLWASILIFVTGNLAGGLTPTSTQRAKALTTLGLLSLVLLIPLTFILAILDAVLSADCMQTNVTKFVTPIIIVFISTLEFGVLAYIVISLRKQAITNKPPPSPFYSSAQREQQIQRQQPANSTNNPSSQFDSSSSSFAAPATAKRRKSAKTPNITVINLPGNSSAPQAPNFIPIPYPQQSQQQNRLLQPIFYPVNKPPNRRYQPNSAFQQPPRAQYQLPSRWYPGGGAGGSAMNGRVVPGAVPFYNSRRPPSNNNMMMGGGGRYQQYGGVGMGGVSPWIRPADGGMF